MEISSRPGKTWTDNAGRMRAGLEGVVEQKRAIAHAHAQLIRHQAGLAEVALEQIAQITSRASREREMPMRSLAAEIACATRMHDITAQKELNDAYELVTRLPATVDALDDARISKRHADVILETGCGIENEAVRAAWEQTVLDFAARETPGRTRAYGRELAEAVNPVGMTERHALACETRGIGIIELDDGMALLQMRLPAVLAHAIADRIRQQARVIRNVASTARARAATPVPTTEADLAAAEPAAATGDGVDDRRTLSQVSADLVCDLLLTGAPTIDPIADRSPGGLGAIRAHVQVVVPVLTLLGTSDAGATLHGRVPIDAATARRLAGDAPGWDRVLCDPITGTVREVDRYTPRADQQRFLRARDQHCRAPGCRQPAYRCQIDHNHEHHESGPTAIGNLAHLCVRHHTLKSETEWTVRQLTDGRLVFTSPLGHLYTDDPPPRVMFIPDRDPPPF